MTTALNCDPVEKRECLSHIVLLALSVACGGVERYPWLCFYLLCCTHTSSI